MSPAELAVYVRDTVSRYLLDKQLPVSGYDLDSLAEEMVDELTGYGPLETLIKDDRINDILVNGARAIFVERDGKLERTALRFIDDDHVVRVIRRILAPLGRRIDESSPLVDARLPDGSRVNAVVPPIALDGPCLSIRKFRQDPLQAGDLLSYGTFDTDLLAFLTTAVKRRCNILVSGGTGAGKTTLLNVLSRFISDDERIVTIEDAAELQLRHEHVVRLETRPPNVDGMGSVVARDLVRNALRMRPDRIVLGEVRGNEVMELLQAMNTGHDGCMSTVHANNSADALLRLEMLAGLAGFQGKEQTLRQTIAASIELVVQIGRLADGKRRILAVVELVGVRDGQFVLNELCRHDAATDRFESGNARPVSPKLDDLRLGPGGFA
ncbi:CpaF family protein [Pseudothauera rhizosphaerae]|uniref:CpaF family protein n=2 Tax=Pseudothauera rhizosphaerae TaxID=2565932 RepID=A0A4S4AX36_9RHOO|nr:CpaF family protein [Pseudothauera rhizosphaerae]